VVLGVVADDAAHAAIAWRLRDALESPPAVEDNDNDKDAGGLRPCLNLFHSGVAAALDVVSDLDSYVRHAWTTPGVAGVPSAVPSILSVKTEERSSDVFPILFFSFILVLQN
jgi:hypothetical protein